MGQYESGSLALQPSRRRSYGVTRTALMSISRVPMRAFARMYAGGSGISSVAVTESVTWSASRDAVATERPILGAGTGSRSDKESAESGAADADGIAVVFPASAAAIVQTPLIVTTWFRLRLVPTASNEKFWTGAFAVPPRRRASTSVRWSA